MFISLDILESKYREFVEDVGRDPGNFYMNLDTFFILYKEVMSEVTGMKLSWEDVKRDGMKYRGISVSITESLYLGEVIAI